MRDARQPCRQPAMEVGMDQVGVHNVWLETPDQGPGLQRDQRIRIVNYRQAVDLHTVCCQSPGEVVLRLTGRMVDEHGCLYPGAYQARQKGQQMPF